MDRKLYSAYEKMTMPSGCSQRIEALLQERAKPWKQQKNQMVYQPKPKPRGWASAAALVCLAVVISLSGVLAFLHMGQWEDREILPPEQTTDQRIKEPPLPLSEEGEDFLLAMCSAMPDWESYFVLNDSFWEEFLYFSFSRPGEGKNGKVKTIIGEIPYENDTVLITREQAESYAELTMDCDLPLPSENGEDGGRMWYADGVYHIRQSEADSRKYVIQSFSTSQQGETFSAHFGVYDKEDRKLGTVRFGLRKADNENGFVVTSKHTDWEIPEQSALQVKGQDQDASLLKGKDVFQQSVWGTADYTAHQYHLPWHNFNMLSSDTCVVYYEEQKGFLTGEFLCHLEDGSWNQTEPKTLNHIHTENGEEWDISFSFGEYDGGKVYLLGTDIAHNENFAIENYGYKNPYENPWWIAYKWEDSAASYTTHELGITEGPWRLDPDTGELKDLWGNVPEENRTSGIQWYLSEIRFFEDGCFLTPSLDAERDIHILYVDPEAGQVYDLETLCGTQLDDFIGLPDSGEIYCWKEGEYWRIPRDTLRPEYLGKLQEDVVFASGVLGGQWATFSIERMAEGGYRVYDYVGNRFLTLEDFPNPYGDKVDWNRVQASPDGRKLLTSQAITLLQVFDCDTGKLLTVEREQNIGPNSKIGWLESSEVFVRTTSWQDYVIYTLK